MVVESERMVCGTKGLTFVGWANFDKYGPPEHNPNLVMGNRSC